VGFRVKSDLRNHQAIVQPRLYDSLMVTQITLPSHWQQRSKAVVLTGAADANRHLVQLAHSAYLKSTRRAISFNLHAPAPATVEHQLAAHFGSGGSRFK
jgi:hypothetical protein